MLLLLQQPQAPDDWADLAMRPVNGAGVFQRGFSVYEFTLRVWTTDRGVDLTHLKLRETRRHAVSRHPHMRFHYF